MNPIDNSKKPLLNDHIIETQRLVQGLETGILYSIRLSVLSLEMACQYSPVLSDAGIPQNVWVESMTRIHQKWSLGFNAFVIRLVVWFLLIGLIIFGYIELIYHANIGVALLFLFFFLAVYFAGFFILEHLRSKSQYLLTNKQVELENAEVFRPQGLWLQLDALTKPCGSEKNPCAIHVYRCSPTQTSTPQ
mmetsp:Transcript_20057/g.34320  ORF Transcript_20057/g.34320 Transcript_20057/m.34320 type:complete len:191 (+) Transcript_20057:2-574(+)